MTHPRLIAVRDAGHATDETEDQLIRNEEAAATIKAEGAWGSTPGHSITRSQHHTGTGPAVTPHGHSRAGGASGGEAEGAWGSTPGHSITRSQHTQAQHTPSQHTHGHSGTAPSIINRTLPCTFLPPAVHLVHSTHA